MRNHLQLLALAAALIAGVSSTAQAQAPDLANTAVRGDTVFATVNGKTISAAQLDAAAKEAYRRKFYHGQPPEAEINQMLREVGQGMIDKLLLEGEVERLNIQPDEKAIADEIAGYERRYQGSPQWAQQRETALPQIRAFLAAKSRLARLEDQMRTPPAPTKQQVEAFYDANKELFTEPEKVHLALITLGVPPSAPTATWEAARTKASELRSEVADKGADFAELAKKYSTDRSAEKGGDLGYVHRGMLGDDVHQQIDKLKPGQLSEPIRSLEGVILVKLVDRKTPALRPLKDVEGRAGELWARKAAEQAWQDYLKKLRASAKVSIGEPFKGFMTEPEAKPQ